MARPKQWYLLWRFWHENKSLQLEMLDGVYASSEREVLDYAWEWWGLEHGQAFKVDVCLTKREIKKAQDLYNLRAIPDDWSKREFCEFMQIPTYSGNQDRYVRQR